LGKAFWAITRICDVGLDEHVDQLRQHGEALVDYVDEGRDGEVVQTRGER
jgi:hypothetical protein